MLSTFFSYAGRIPRQTFWLALLALIVVQVVLSYALKIAFGLPPGYWEGNFDLSHPYMLASIGISILALWPTLAVFAKRRHDRDKSGWALIPAYIIMLIPTGIIFSNPDIMPKPPAVPGGAPIMPADPTAMLMFGAAGLLSMVVLIWLIVTLGFLRGTSGPNSFGEDPLGGVASDGTPPGNDWAS